MLMYFECICIYLLHLSLTVLYKLSETTHTHTLTHTYMIFFFIIIYLKFFFNFIQFLKVAFNLVITKYWLYFPCCTVILSWAYLKPNSLYLPLPDLCIYPSRLSLLVTTSLFSISVSLLLVIFTSLLYVSDYTYKWYHTVFLSLYK